MIMTRYDLNEFEIVIIGVIGFINLSNSKACCLGIWDELSMLSNGSINLGTIYSTVFKLLKKGYIESFLEIVTKENCKRHKRTFVLTELGKMEFERSYQIHRKDLH